MSDEMPLYPNPEGFDGTCPRCGAANDTLSAAVQDGLPPHAGALALCLHCGVVGKIGRDRIAMPDDDEWDAILSDEGVQRAIWAVAVMRARGEAPLPTRSVRTEDEDGGE